jgi:hypothetical protein
MTQRISIEKDPAAFLKAYVDFANSERQVIWGRNSAMLVANSFMLTALGVSQFRTIQLAIASAGMVVCTLWFAMTLRGWHHYYQLHQNIKDISDISFEHVEPRRRYVYDLIFICTALLILLFFIIHAIAWWQIRTSS